MPTVNGRQAMIAAEALASMLIALILPAILRRSRSTRDRLPSASERLPPALCWIAITMPKKFASATGTRSEQLRDRVGDRYPKRLRVDDRPELAAQRLLGLAGDHAHAVAERQPGLDAAHDHVDGVRKLLQEALDSAILEIGEEPARKAEPADEDPAGRDDRVARDDEQREGEAEGGDGADDEQFPLRPGQPRLCDPRAIETLWRAF